MDRRASLRALVVIVLAERHALRIPAPSTHRRVHLY
jgi:hypothetical protein